MQPGLYRLHPISLWVRKHHTPPLNPQMAALSPPYWICASQGFCDIHEYWQLSLSILAPARTLLLNSNSDKDRSSRWPGSLQSWLWKDKAGATSHFLPLMLQGFGIKLSTLFPPASANAQVVACLLGFHPGLCCVTTMSFQRGRTW